MTTITSPAIELDLDRDVAPMVFIHGWGCDRSFLAPQHDYFAATRRCLSVDLPGHGAEPNYVASYEIADLARDVAKRCTDAGMEAPVLVGHSLGGSVALECAARHCPDAQGVVMIDSYLFPLGDSDSDDRSNAVDMIMADGIVPMLADLRAMLMAPGDAEAVWQRFATSITATDRHVLAACLRGLHGYDPDKALRGSATPSAYIAAETLVVDEARLVKLRPNTRFGRVIGAGHFSPLLVPNQINAMLDGFLARGGLA